MIMEVQNSCAKISARDKRDFIISYDVLLPKYLELNRQMLRNKNLFDEIAVNFDEMLHVLILSPDLSGLHVTAQLLDICLEVFKMQIEAYQTIMITLASSSKEARNKSGNRKDLQLSNVAITSADENVDNPNYSESTEDSSRGHRLSQKTSRKKPLQPGRFIVANENCISFHAEDVTPDVIHRRKFLTQKFQELANDSACSNFDIGLWYDRDDDVLGHSHGGRDSESMRDETILFRDLRNQNTYSNVDFPLIPLFNYAYDDGDMENSESETHEQVTTINEIEENEKSENENIHSTEEPISLQIQMPILENFSCNNNNENEEQENVGNGSAEMENQGKELLKQKRKRKLLEPINPIPMMENDESIEYKRGRFSEFFDTFNISSLIVERCSTPIMETAEMPSLIPISDLALEEDDDIELPALVDTIQQERPLSPLGDFDSSTVQLQPRLRPCSVDMKAIIRNMEGVIDRELLSPTRGTEKSVSFINLIHESGVNIIEKNEEVSINSSSSRLNTSVSGALFAILHMAHHKNVLLIPDENNILNVTRNRLIEPKPDETDGKTPPNFEVSQKTNLHHHHHLQQKFLHIHED